MQHRVLSAPLVLSLLSLHACSAINQDVCDGEEISVTSGKYCVLEKPASSAVDDPECSSDFPHVVTSARNVVVCADKNSGHNEREVYAAYDRAVCAPANMERCGRHACEWIPASSRWFLEDDVCVEAADGVCIASIGELGNAESCQFRTNEQGTLEVVKTESTLLDGLWTTSASNPACDCITDPQP